MNDLSTRDGSIPTAGTLPKWRPGWILSLATGLAGLFVGLIALTPLLEAAGVPGQWLVNLAGSQVCHQLPERSFTVGAGQMAVCARCFALYLGGVLGLFVFLATGLLAGRRLATGRWLLLFVVPSATDALLHLILGLGLSNTYRLWISIPAGIALGLFLAEGLDDLSRPLGRRGVAALEEIP